MNDIIYIDRRTGQKHVEKVYKGKALKFLYGNSWQSRVFSSWLLPILVKWPLFSMFYGILQKKPCTKRNIKPFIKAFNVDSSEFLETVDSFGSFNDFFIRRLKPEARPIINDPSIAVIPADGRYYFFENIDECDGFIVKGQKFDLATLLDDASLALAYKEGSMVLARLCPSDYHRFHFPCECIPGPTKVINGYLYSVNPLAIRKNIHIFSQNKRTLCELESLYFGRVLYLEIGATTVGSIQQTYTPNQTYKKGFEKGYFEFGGSSLILLFAKNTILFDQDLLKASAQGLEMLCQMGQSMGKSQIKP